MQRPLGRVVRGGAQGPGPRAQRRGLQPMKCFRDRPCPMILRTLRTFNRRPRVRVAPRRATAGSLAAISRRPLESAGTARV